MDVESIRQSLIPYLTLPSALDSAKFYVKWWEWCQYCQSKSLNTTNIVVNEQIKFLEGGGLDKAVQAIDQAKAQGSQNLHQPLDTPTQSPDELPIAERIKAYEEQRDTLKQQLAALDDTLGKHSANPQDWAKYKTTTREQIDEFKALTANRVKLQRELDKLEIIIKHSKIATMKF
jgi:hypothetical protein